MRKLLGLSLLVAALFLVAVPAHANVFVARHTGVPAGTWVLYDSNLNDIHYMTKITVDNVAQTWYNLTVQLYELDGVLFNTQNVTFSVYSAGGMVPFWFIAAGLSGGDPVYAGMNENLVQSFFGHVVAGGYRQVLYSDNTNVVGEVNHKEWDKATGILTSFLFEDNGTGWSERLLSTNAWSSSSFWGMAAAVLPIFWAAVPIAAFFGFMYFLFFFLAAIKDWMHMRSLKAVRSGKMGGMMWFQIKIMIIASLIIMAIMITALVLLSLVLSH